MKNIINISEAAVIAIHAMFFISTSPEKQLSVKEIAARMGASSNHLSKVLQLLAKKGLVKSVRGPSGGYSLGRSAEKITLKDIYEVIEGTLVHSECLFPKPICGREECIFGDMIPFINEKVIETLTNTKLSQLK